MQDDPTIPVASQVGDPPVLAYGVAPRRRRWVRYVVGLLLIGAALWFTVPPALHRVQVWQAARTLAYGTAPPDRVAVGGEQHWDKHGWGSGWSGNHPKANALAIFAPGPIGLGSMLTFAHQRTAGGGPHLVVVSLAVGNRPKPNGRATIDLIVGVAPIGQPLTTTTTTTVDLGPAGAEGELNLDLLAGQPDPNDPARFTIGVYVQDRPGRIAGRLAADGSVAFDFTGLPAMPAGAFDPPPRPAGETRVTHTRSVRPPP